MLSGGEVDADGRLGRSRRGEITVADAPPEVAEVLERCALAKGLTGGWFDPWSAPGDQCPDPQ